MKKKYQKAKLQFKLNLENEITNLVNKCILIKLFTLKLGFIHTQKYENIKTNGIIEM